LRSQPRTRETRQGAEGILKVKGAGIARVTVPARRKEGEIRKGGRLIKKR